MNGKLIFTEYTFHNKSRDVALFCQDNRMEYLKILPEESALAVGTILIGKVNHQVLNIPAAFLSLDKEGAIGFLSTKNTEYLKVLNRSFQGKLADGDDVLLQVRREPVKSKEYTVSGCVELHGRFCVARFGSGRLFFSKSHQASVKNVISSYFRQKALCAPDLSLIGYSGYDLILRTSAQSMTDSAGLDILYQDCTDTLSALSRMVSEASHRSCYSILDKPADWLGSICEELSACGFQAEEYVTDSHRLNTSLQEYAAASRRMGISPLEEAHVTYYQDEQVPLSVLYHIPSRIDEALHTRVWLKNGGYLCIEQTEAMTVVDVNTGKAVHGRDSEKLFFDTNLEAASEILRQLRLRNITGIILIDFINMTDPSHEEAILKLMRAQAVRDYRKIHIYDFTRLGLLEMTREKRGKSLSESLQ